MNVLCERDFLVFLLVEAGEAAVIHVWIDIVLGRDCEETGGEGTTGTPVSPKDLLISKTDSSLSHAVDSGS